MKKIIIFIFVIIGIFTYSKDVLILNSYSYDFPLTEKITKGIFDGFKDAGKDVNFQVEYLDSRKMLNSTYYEKMADVYKYKFNHMKFDVIICSDNEALEFIIKYRKDIFNDTPIVFCGINRYRKQMLNGEKNVTGIIEELDIKDTLKEAFKLQKNIKNIIVLNDRTNSGINFRKIIEEEKIGEKFGKNVIFIDDYNIGIEEIPSKIKVLSKESILFFTFFTIDKDGTKISNEETINRIHKEINIPIYGLYEAFLGKGIVGGKLVSRYSQGLEAAQIAVKILDGERAENIPITLIKPEKLKFDYKELKKNEIDISKISEDAVIINKTKGFYEKNKTIVLFTISLFILLLTVIALLIGNILKNKKINKIIKKSQEKAEQNINLVKNIINTAPSIYCLKDGDGKIVLTNDAFDKFFKTSPDKSEGKSIIDIFVEGNFDIEDAKQMIETEKKVMESGRGIFGIEEKIVCSTYEYWFYSNIVPIKIEAEKIYYLRVSLDITNKKKSEIELKNEKERAENASVAKGHFLAKMSHEIRTPLNGIITMIEQIKYRKDKIAESKIQRELEIIDISAKRLYGVIDNVLNISKIEYGEIEFESKNFNMRDEILKSIIIFDEKIKEKNIDVFLCIENSVPLIVRGDLVKYQQIITNIIGNAIKFTQKGHIEIKMKSIYEKSGIVKLRLEVKDTGIGISKENQEKIFQKFSQVEKFADKSQNGVGLGLAIAKELAERAGGLILLESEQGRGSSFFIDIPFRIIEGFKNYPVNDKKEIIIISDKKEYIEIYAEIIKNFKGLGFIIAEDAKELESIIENCDNKYILADLTGYDKKVEEILSKIENRAIVVKNGNYNVELKMIERYLVQEKLNSIMNLKEERTVEEPGVRFDFTSLNGKILIVEDDEVNKEAIKIMLRNTGLESIEIASDGDEAVKKYRDQRYPLILMDMQLPVKNGFEAYKEIREIEKERGYGNSKIIAVTANAMEDYKNSCIEFGFDGYITKPVEQRRLFETIAELFKIKSINIIKLNEEYKGKKEILHQLMKSVEENLPLLIEEVKKCIIGKDMKMCAEKAHKLKGAVGNIKADAVYNIADEMEKSAKEMKIDRVTQLFVVLEIESRNLLESIKENMKK